MSNLVHASLRLKTIRAKDQWDLQCGPGVLRKVPRCPKDCEEKWALYVRNFSPCLTCFFWFYFICLFVWSFIKGFIQLPAVEGLFFRVLSPTSFFCGFLLERFPVFTYFRSERSHSRSFRMIGFVFFICKMSVSATPANAFQELSEKQTPHSWRWCSQNVGLWPVQLLRVENVEICQVLVPTVTTLAAA